MTELCFISIEKAFGQYCSEWKWIHFSWIALHSRVRPLFLASRRAKLPLFKFFTVRIIERKSEYYLRKETNSDGSPLLEH